MKFRVVDNLHEQVMLDFLAFMRYAHFKDDLAQLYLAKNQANTEARNRRKHQNNIDSDEDADLQNEDVFNGCQMKF